MASSESVDNSFILSTSIIFFHGRVTGLISLSLPFFPFHSVFHSSCMASLIYKTGLDRGMLSFHLPALMLLWLFYLRFCFLEHLCVQVSSRVPLFFLIPVGSLWCASVFVLLDWSEIGLEELIGIISSLWILRSSFLLLQTLYSESFFYNFIFLL